MSNFGTKENFCEVYNSSLKCFIFIHHERDTRTFFFRWAMWTTGFRYGNMMKFATVLIDLRLFCRCVIVCRIYHPMKTSYQWQSGEEIAQHSLNREGATNSLPRTTKKDVRENHHWQSSVASGDSWIIRILLPYSYYPRIVLRDFFKVAKISTNRVRYVNRSYIRNEKWRHGYYTGLFWRLWADDMLINFAPEIDRFIFTFYVVFIISCILVS